MKPVKPYVRFEVFTAVTMKNGVFWVVPPCGSCKNPNFEVSYAPVITDEILTFESWICGRNVIKRILGIVVI
jgi:hypothetical protein